MDVHDGGPGLEGQGYGGVVPEILGVKGNLLGNGGEKPGLGILGTGVMETLRDGDGELPRLHLLPGGEVQAPDGSGKQLLGLFAQNLPKTGRGGELQSVEQGEDLLFQDVPAPVLVRDAQARQVVAHLGIVHHADDQVADRDVEAHDPHPLVDHAQGHIAPGDRLFIGPAGFGGGEIGLKGQAALPLLRAEGVAVLVALALVLVLREASGSVLQALLHRLGGFGPGGLNSSAEEAAEAIDLPRRLRPVVQLEGAVPVELRGGPGLEEIHAAVLVPGVGDAEGQVQPQSGKQLQFFAFGGYSVHLHGSAILSLYCLAWKCGRYLSYHTRRRRKKPYAGCIGSAFF